MNYLERRLWRCEEVTGDEILPSNALLFQLMYHHDIDQRVMIYAAMLLCWGLLLYKKIHPLYVAIHEVWNAHHTYPREMHQQMDMVRIEARESALETEILNDELHQWCKLILKKYEWKYPAQLPHIPRFDVWLIVGFL